jgi:cell wall-associated NlpC family hydrolase
MRRLVLEEARSWVHTPYHHNAHLKGVGVDCLWILIECFKPVVPALSNFKPGNYSREWYFHRDEELYLQGVALYARRLPEGSIPQPADIALYKVGRCVSHGAILVDDELLIHANRKAREVEISLRHTTALDKHFHSYWTAFP